MAVEPVFLFALVDQITGFGQVSALTMLHHLFLRYGKIDKINLEESSVKMMGSYAPAETLDQLIEIFEKVREFSQARGRTIADATMVSKISPC